MRLLTTFSLLTISLTATGQIFPSGSGFGDDILFIESYKTQKPLTHHPATSIDTEFKYTDSAGNGVIIQSSLPKGGGRYTDPAGKTFGYVIFWTRIVNESASPLELTLGFSADSFAIPGVPDAYVKIFLPSDTMTLDKVTLYDYGLTDVNSFLDTGAEKPATVQRVLNSRGECLFYIGLLLYEGSGPVRTRLVLKEDRLFYRINLLDFALIPCGQIVFDD